MIKAESVDEYLAKVPTEAARRALQRLREIIRDEAPEAVECISYGMPGYKQNGYLLGFAAFKEHCSLFPGGAVQDFPSDLEGYKTSKGTIQFKPDKPLPEALVRKIVRARIATRQSKK